MLLVAKQSTPCPFILLSRTSVYIKKAQRVRNQICVASQSASLADFTDSLMLMSAGTV